MESTISYGHPYASARIQTGTNCSENKSTPLPTAERHRMSQASTHWLRHIFGTRAIAKDVPLDVIQAQMGHASIQTTTAIYGRAPMRRRIDELDRAFK
jgi:integrase